MCASNYPTLRLDLKPYFSSTDGSTTHLSVIYHIDARAFQSEDAEPDVSDVPVFQYTTFAANVPHHIYQPDSLAFRDSLGPLLLSFQTSRSDPNLQIWTVPRRPMGNMILSMDVYPRQVDEKTPLGQRIDMRLDQGGLQTGGGWFLPQLICPGEKLFSNVVQWDLDGAPAGTRAVWSHGEGPAPVTQVGTVNTFVKTLFAVGPIRSYPPEPVYGALPGFCACYWFGGLPKNLARLVDFNSAIFTPMAKMFREEGASYRILLRKSIVGFGGSAFEASYMMEYDQQSGTDESDNGIRELFAHEMVHSFVGMAPEQGVQDEDNYWFEEGIAEFYSTFLPYRFGLVPSTYVRWALNRQLSGYLTNPEIQMSSREAKRKFFSTWYAEKIPYLRGFTFLLIMDARLRKASGATKDPKSSSPLDEIVIQLGIRFRRGEVLNQRDWLEALKPWFEDVDSSRRELQQMLDGRILNLENTFVSTEANTLDKVKQKVLQIGFDRAAISSRIVGHVVPDSNVEKAGLRVGDRIIEYERFGGVFEDPEVTCSMLIQRGSDQKAIKWLPREDREVLVWQLDRFNAESS